MPLTPVLHACPPRGNMTEAEDYAANLDKAMTGEIAAPEGAAEFFAATYPAQPMKSACRMVFDRLHHGSASGAPSVYRFTSVYGGGKTHTLIALAAGAKHPDVIRQGKTNGLIPPDLATDDVKIVSFNGKDSDLTRGTRLDESGLRAKSLTGFIAYHVGGPQVLEDFKVYDEKLSDPGGRGFGDIFGDKPVLILVDELVEWVSRAMGSGLPAANIKQTISALAHAIASSPRTALVMTAPEQNHDAFKGAASMELHSIMDSVASTVARQAHDMTPSGENDLAAILRQRLFTTVDETARRETAVAYAQIARRTNPADTDAEQRFLDNYPFHPDLIDIIQSWLFANGDFQRARGAIRLMANVIDGHADIQDALIHPYHVDMQNRRVHDHLIAGLHHEQIAPAITTDITGEQSTAARIGTDLARWAGNIILLGSLAPESVSGIDDATIAASILSPRRDDPAVIAAAVSEYTQKALFLDETPTRRGHRFTQQPNVRRMVHERKERITDQDVIADKIRDAVRNEYDPDGPSPSKNTLRVTMYPSRVNSSPDERDNVYLSILAANNFNWSARDGNEHIIAELHHEKPGGSEAIREHRNNVLYLVADDDNLETIRENLLINMAANAVKKEQGANLLPYQMDNLDEIISSSRKALSQSIQNKWTHLIYPTAQHTFSDAAPHLTEETLTAATDREGDGQAPIIAKLIERQKMPDPKLPHLNPSVWRQTLLSSSENAQTGMSIADVHRIFTASPGQSMMRNRDAFREVMIAAIESKDLFVESATGQAITDQNAAVGIEDDFRVWIFGKEPRCQKCNERTRPDEPCTCQTPSQPPTTPPDIIGIQEPRRIPEFRSEIVKASDAVRDLKNYMSSNHVDFSDLQSLDVMSTKPDDLTYLADSIGARAEKATFKVEIHSNDNRVHFTLEGQTADEWRSRAVTVNRVQAFAARGEEAEPPAECQMTFSANDCAPEEISAAADAMDNRRDVAIRAEFKPANPEVQP